jgi:hypothetical protein
MVVFDARHHADGQPHEGVGIVVVACGLFGRACRSPKDHGPLGHVTDENVATLDPVRRLNRRDFDAAWIDGLMIVERDAIEVSVDRTEIGEVGSAAGHGIKPSVSRGCARQAGQRGDSESKSDLGGVRHFLIPKFHRTITGVQHHRP